MFIFPHILLIPVHHITENIQASEGCKYFPEELHVGQLSCLCKEPYDITNQKTVNVTYLDMRTSNLTLI